MSYLNARYDQVSFKASHNSYQRLGGSAKLPGSLTAQLNWGPQYGLDPGFYGCRGLELDINRHSDGSNGGSRGYFRVSHAAAPFGTNYLSRYLDILLAWHHQRPMHDPIFVTIDVKSEQGSKHAFPNEIDTYLSAWFERSLIFTPANLLWDPGKDLCTNVVAAGWPMVRDMRGKFVFCLSGNGDWKSYYAALHPAQRLCFADMDVKGDDGSLHPPVSGTRAIFNIHLYSKHYTKWREVVPRFRARNFITRGYTLNGKQLWNRALAAGINVMATDKVADEPSWAYVAKDAPFRLVSLPGVDPLERPVTTPVHAVSRSADKLDIFATDTTGRVMSAAWQPAFSDGWRGWWHIQNGKAHPGAPVTAVSRSVDKLDIFVTGTGGRVYTAAWEPGRDWRGWWRIGDIRLPLGAELNVVSRSADKLDIFATDTTGRVMSAAWQPAFSDGWRGWWHIQNGKAHPGAPVTAVSRSVDKLDIFVTGTGGHVYTAAWEPGRNWRGWWRIGNLKVRAGTRIAAVSRHTDHLDIVATGADGRVYTAAWQPNFTDGWRGWWRIGDLKLPPGSQVHAVSRSRDKLDVFATDTDGRTCTAAWQPNFTDGWRGWWHIRGGKAKPGAPITAVSRSTNKLDVFVANKHAHVWSAAWQPDVTDGWRGWWRLEI